MELGNRTTESPPTARLTRLELQGFKSFANRTVFEFDAGITAVVGPNGSGKSNIADAIRWVLGETSYNALRSKKTEDVVFAGGRGRAPAGLAEVTVVFNNEEKWLPSEFLEVSVTRRAFRGGENQYLINGRRVRLKDIAFLTASLGQSYTVVGQGLVDAALSQRPEDRRGLFEHAADLGGLRMKVSDAERNLDEARNNTERLTDLLAEIEPRLKTLERAARQAREWQGLRNRLTTIQQHHYLSLLRDASARLQQAQDAVTRQSAVVATLREQIDTLTTARDQAQASIVQARDTLATHDARLDVLRTQLQRLTHERELVEERQGALSRRRADMRDTQAGLDDQVATVTREQEQIAGTIRNIEAELETARQAVEHLQASVRATRQEWQDREQEAATIQRDILATERQMNDLTRQRALIEQRQETGAAERERLAREREERDSRIASIESDLADLLRQDESIATEASTVQDRLAALQATIETHRKDADQIVTTLRETESALANARNRLDFLQRMSESGSNLHAGARQVMQWHREQSLSGIAGTLAELISIDPLYDTAIEVALGGHLQDIVVHRWSDAEQAIRRLKQSRSGRATFQPLDTVGRYGRNRSNPNEFRNQRGVHGIAADLVTTSAEVEPVVRSLLGRFVVTEDLPTARNLLDSLPGGWSAVTLAGEIARSSGSVTGGAAVRESGALGRERELRELPATIRDLEQRLAGITDQRTRIAASEREHTSTQNQLQSQLAGLAAQQRERNKQRTQIETWLHDLRRQQEQANSQVAAAGSSQTSQQADLDRIAAELRELTATRDTARERHTELLNTIASQRESGSDDDEHLLAAQRALAGLEERLRAEQRRATSLAAQREALAGELTLRAERLAALDGEQTAHKSQLARLAQEIAGLEESLQVATTERVPLAATVEQASEQRETTGNTLETTRQDLLTQERTLNQQELTLERVRADHTAIEVRITEDLALDDPQELPGTPLEAPPADDAAFTDPVVAEREISRLKERLRRVGYVGEDVVGEFERESEHHQFLRTQLDDVEAASTSLRQMLQELHDTMQRQFQETFAKVAAEFTTSFTTLFGGGTARLILTSGEESSTGRPGVDIVAQPPGKRLQNLALLSGGERSLTGVALLFAILRVSPSPFILLDEVDAALDEANVLRFREELQVLATATQAIVITHNRGTVEIADTLYGITMGGDGISQVLSLRLSDVPTGDESATIPALANLT